MLSVRSTLMRNVYPSGRISRSRIRERPRYMTGAEAMVMNRFLEKKSSHDMEIAGKAKDIFSFLPENILMKSRCRASCRIT